MYKPPALKGRVLLRVRQKMNELSTALHIIGYAYCIFRVHGQIMECTGRCVAVSEPNSPTIVARKYQKFGDSSTLRQLARDVIRWECRPYPTIEPPPLGYFLKLMAHNAVVLPMLK